MAIVWWPLRGGLLDSRASPDPTRQVRCCVLDEPTDMIDMGLIHAIRQIIENSCRASASI